MVEPGTGMAAFIDVETTGLNPAKDEIIELAIALFSFDRETGEIIETIDEYCDFREPTCSISREATAVNGISKRQIKGCYLDDKKIKEIVDKAEFIIAHNARFDASFIVKLFPDVLSKPWYCSMNGIDWKYKGFKSKGLQNLLKDHNIQVDEAHRASSDVEAGIKLLSQTNENGVTYLLELIRGKKVYLDNLIKNPSFDYEERELSRSYSSEYKTKETTQERGFKEGCLGCLGVIIFIIIMSIICSFSCGN
jgi:DNA polymerase-3 subunit epsilon